MTKTRVDPSTRAQRELVAAVREFGRSLTRVMGPNAGGVVIATDGADGVFVISPEDDAYVVDLLTVALTQARARLTQ